MSGFYSPICSPLSRPLAANVAALGGGSAVPSWQTVRANGLYGDYIHRDGAVLKFFGDVAYLFGGWRGAGVSIWNSHQTTNEVWNTYDFGRTWSLVLPHDEATTTRPSRRHTPGTCSATIGGTDYLYIIGGDVEDSAYPDGHSDVWRISLVSGVLVFEKMAVHGTPGWDGRDLISAGFLNGKLYILGGSNVVDGVYGDMWESSDAGATWSQTMPTVLFEISRAAGELVTFKNKLWLIAGGYTDHAHNYVWSFNGTSWTRELGDGHAQFTQKFYNNQVVYGGRIFTICGETSENVNLAETNYTENGPEWPSIASPIPANHAVALGKHSSGVLLACGNSMETSTFWLSTGDIPDAIDQVTALAPDQLLLVENLPAHYTEVEWPLHSHFLKDYSVGYRSGDPIPGYAPSHSLTGDGASRYASVGFGAENIGGFAGAIEIEFAFKTPATNGARTGIVSHGNDSNWTYALTLEASYQLGWRHDFTLLHTGTTVLSPSTWYRIRVNKTGSAGAWVIRFYINEVLDSTLNTSDNAQLWPTPSTYLLIVPTNWYSAGSITDVRFTYNGKNYRLPCCEGSQAALSWFETIGGTHGNVDGVLNSAAMWGTMTDHTSRVANWIMEHGGNLDAFGSFVPAYNGIAANDGPIDLVSSKFINGTIDCDPLGVGAGGLGLESALTPTTERNAASSGKRRRRVQYGYVDRIAAKASAMSSTAANNYFYD